MAIYSQVLSQYVRKQPYDEAQFIESLQELVKVVVLRHFKNHMGDKDVMSMGVTKALETLRKPYIDPSRNLVNILYSAIRNEIGNNIKAEKRILVISSSFDDSYSDHSHSNDTSKCVNLERSVDSVLEKVAQNMVCFGIAVPSVVRGYTSKLNLLRYYEQFTLQASTAWAISVGV